MSTYNPYAYRPYSVTKQTEVINHKTRTTKNVIIQRRRALFCLLVMFSIVMSLFIFKVTASPTNGNELREGEYIINVYSGDTLWELAKRHLAETGDTAYGVFLIKDRNQLDSHLIVPGQKLIIPIP